MKPPKLKSKIDLRKPDNSYYWWEWQDGSKSLEFADAYSAREWLRQGWAKPQQEPSAPKAQRLTPRQRDLLGALQSKDPVDWDSVDARTVLSLSRRGLIKPGLEESPWVPTESGMKVLCDY